MSLETVESIKRNKPFKPWDILVYALVIIAVAAMFISVFVKNEKQGDITGIKIEYDNNLIATFYYADNSLVKEVGYEEWTVMSEEKEGYKIEIYTPRNDGDFNIMYIEKSSGIVTMLNANCSLVIKDCTYMSIKKASDSIICIPHDLVISPITEGLFIPEL